MEIGAFLEDFDALTAHSPASFERSGRGLLLGERTVLDGMCVVAVGAAQRARVCAQDWAHHAAIGRLQHMRAVHLFRRAVIPTEHADLGLLLGARCRRLAHFPIPAEQLESRETSSSSSTTKSRVALMPYNSGAMATERAERREALLELKQWRGRRACGWTAAAARRGRGAARGRAAAVVQVRGARARSRVVEAQCGFQRLRYGVGARSAAGTALAALRHQRGQAQIVVPEVKCVVVGRART